MLACCSISTPVLGLLLLIAQIAPGPPVTYEFDISSYDLVYRIDVKRGVFEAEQDIVIVNASRNEQDRIHFRIHPDLKVRDITIHDLRNGVLPVTEWKLGSHESILGNELQIVEVRTTRAIAPDEKLRFHLEYQLPPQAFKDSLQGPERILDFFVNTGLSQAIGPYTGHNAIFNRNVMAPFRMTIERPEDFLCSAPGTRTASRRMGNSVIETYRSEHPGIPTFSCSIYDKRIVEEGGITFEYYLYPGQGFSDDMATATARIVRLYTEAFGDPGTDTYRFANVGASDSEYPGWESKGNAIFLTDLTTRHYAENDFVRAMYAGMVAHEIFHNWNIFSVHWAGPLNDWFEEGGANFVAAWACERLFAPEVAIGGRAHFAESYDGDLGYRGYESNETLESVSKADLGSSETMLIYYYGALVWEQLRQKLGDEVMFAALGDFFRRHSLKAVTYPDLLGSLQAKTDVDVEAYLDQWMTNNAQIDLSIGDVQIELQDGRYRTELDFVLEAERDYEVLTSIGYKTSPEDSMETVPVRATRRGIQRISFEGESEPILIQVDPYFRVPQINLANNVWQR